jgi:hypothetical protein
MTQAERVLALSRRPDGICQAELLDHSHGAPITRLAARIQNLEDRGYEFENLGIRRKTKVYRLIDVEGPVSTSEPIPPDDQGTDAPTLQAAGGALSAERLFEDEPVFACRSHWIEE